MRYFPVFFNLRERRVLIVGGGEVALRKLALLERTGAHITVIAPVADPQIESRAAHGALRLITREFSPEDLRGMSLVIVATSRRAVNRWIALQCDAQQIPVNVVDDREASRFIVPAIVDRDPVVVAISTGGASPVLARRVRERLEASLPRRLGDLARWLAQMRVAAQRLRGPAARRKFIETLIDGAAARRLIDGDALAATAIARDLLANTANSAAARGEVTLVGAGPGDPELLTLKGLRALQDADVILYDRLVSASVLDLARRDAERICVGKTGGGAATPQETINALLIEHARRGKRVVRLKGGDPFIFGRGGEELEALAAARIPASVVPGITAALGAAASSGISLTHRDHAHSVTFVTAHAEGEGGAPNWQALAMPGQTAVFYMGLARIEHIAAQLIAHGAPVLRPAGVVAAATGPSQQVIVGTLGDIHGRCARAAPLSPALLIVGDVVALREKLDWLTSAAMATGLSASA